MLERIVIWVLDTAKAGGGWHIGRWLRKDHINEEINRREATARLIATMRELGVGMPEIEAALARMDPSDEPPPVLAIEDQLEQQEYALIARAQTQAGINEAQRRRLTRLDWRMRAALDDLSEVLDDKQRRLLAQSQAAWEPTGTG
jgi:DNA-binding transcriptional MerR regulator